MSDIPLTPEQGTFAAENHGLVLKFLNENHLPENEYYDVVIFGYLDAVRDYFTRSEMSNYSFSTIAWRAMRGALSNNNRTENRKMRTADVLSLNGSPHEDYLPLEHSIPYGHDLMMELETQLIMHDLARRISEREMSIVNMRRDGYNIREIARSHNVPMKYVHEALSFASAMLKQLCYE